MLELKNSQCMYPSPTPNMSEVCYAPLAVAGTGSAECGCVA